MKKTIYIIGDSTAANKLKEKRPESGWGEHLHRYFSSEITIENHALNGSSSKSFINEGRFDVISAALKEGDYLLIQFGHNDQKIEDPTRYTEPYGSFQENIKTFVTVARENKAIPIILTPMVRRIFKDGLVDKMSAGDYYTAVLAVGEDMAVVTLDLFDETVQLLTELGEEQSVALYLHLKPGEHLNYPQGVVDNTHFSEHGARKLAQVVVKTIKKQVPELAPYMSERKRIK